MEASQIAAVLADGTAEERECAYAAIESVVRGAAVERGASVKKDEAVALAVACVRPLVVSVWEKWEDLTTNRGGLSREEARKSPSYEHLSGSDPSTEPAKMPISRSDAMSWDLERTSTRDTRRLSSCSIDHRSATNPWEKTTPAWPTAASPPKLRASSTTSFH